MSGSWLAYMRNTLAPKPFHLFFPFSPISLKTIEEPSKGNPPSPDANLHLIQHRSPPSPNLQNHLQRAAVVPISSIMTQQR